MRVAIVIASTWSWVTYKKVAPSSRPGALQLDPQLGAQLGVQRGQRLVHQGHAGAADQGAADRDTLHLAARQAGSGIIQLVRDPQRAGDGGDAGAYLGLGDACCRGAERKSQVVVNRQMRVERILLKHESDVPRGRRQPGGVAPSDDNAPGIRTLQPC